MIIPTNIGGRIKQNYSADQLKKMRKQMPYYIKSSMKKAFDVFFRKFKSKHFMRSAFQRYPHEYEGFGKKRVGKQLKIAVQRGKDTTKPLVKSGALKDAFLNADYMFKGSTSKELKADFINLPDYAYKTRKTQNNKQKALTAVNEEEIEFYGEQFDKYLQHQIDANDGKGKLKKNYGRAIL